MAAGKTGSGRTRKKANAQSWEAEPRRARNVGASEASTSDEVSNNGQTARPISSGPLSPLPDLHARPIEVVVCDRPLGAFARENLSRGRLGA